VYNNQLKIQIMFTKTNLISTIVAAIWSFMGGFLFWGILAEDFMNNHLGTATGMGKEMPDFGLLAFGCLVQAFAFSSIFRNWGSDSYTPMDGLKYGIWAGILVGFGHGLINHATTNFLDMTGSVVNGFIYVVFYAVMGLLVGWIYKKVK
jgi:thiamine transporter ThiT